MYLFSLLLGADSHVAGLTVARLMGGFHLLRLERLVLFILVFMVALDAYLLDQPLQQDVEVLCGEAWLFHHSGRARLAFLTAASDFDGSLSLPRQQLHVEQHHHPTGGPLPRTL